MKRVIALAIVGLMSGFSLQAQEEEDKKHLNVEETTGAKHDGHKPEAIHTIKELFSKGHIGGDIRYFFMGTNHVDHGEFYYANAIGGRLNYHTAEFHGFHLAIAGLFVFDLGSSEYEEEMLTLYERELFDLTHPHNRNDLDRMEELFIQYRYKNSFAKFGKMDINTPLMNPRDTRMKPYVFNGFWGEYNQIKNLRANAGWIYGASPRSTTHWFEFDDAIDLYQRGVTTSGVPIEETGGYTSKGVAIGGLTYQLAKGLSVQGWWYYMDQIANSMWLQTDIKRQLMPKWNWVAGAIYVHQTPIENDAEYSYMDEGQVTDLYSGRIGLAGKRAEFYVNYTTVGNAGRFVFPQEFGRAKVYTLIPRGELEGMGNVSNLVLSGVYKPKKLKDFTVQTAISVLDAPEWDNAAKNKYGIPSYHHFTLDLGYRFHKLFEGLDVHALYVYKDATELNDFPETEDEVHFNFHQINLIANIYF
ncbi:MAG: hypothetical protein CL843_04290 [Crocinitomicaceae bacterium]|nr:hypothetical protein [Crocinitomicaceae bacterium]|tara:strand:- start:7696 stop:9111 length:1416 start_codon:yes stop_codon:yes gene_type:complete